MGRKRNLTKFPVARIKKIMQADEDVGKIATSTPVLVAKALECLMEDVLRDSASLALGRHTKTISPQHLKHIIDNQSHLDFLRPTVGGVPRLDDPNAPSTSRRGKRVRSAPAEPASVSPPAPVSRVKRTRTPRVAPPPADQSADKSDRSSPPLPIKTATTSPSVSQSVLLPTPRPRDEEDDEDYDEGDDEEEMPAAVESGDPPPHSTERVSVRALLS